MLKNNQKELILLKDLGMKFPTEKSTYKVRFGLYKCFCGKEFETQIKSVKSKNTRSCGCIHNEIFKTMITKHQDSKNRLYKIYNNMIQRCTVDKKNYVNYFGRNIKVCNEWINSYEIFKNWSLENGYQDNLTIDRINNDGNYEPSNCRWVDMKTQARNTRKLRVNNISGYRGVDFKNNKWRSRICVNYKSIYLGAFDTALESALAYDKYVIDNNLEHTLNFKG